MSDRARLRRPRPLRVAVAVLHFESLLGEPRRTTPFPPARHDLPVLLQRLEIYLRSLSAITRHWPFTLSITRGASRSLDAVGMARNQKSTHDPSDGHESRRWREGVSTRRDAEMNLFCALFVGRPSSAALLSAARRVVPSLVSVVLQNHQLRQMPARPAPTRPSSARDAADAPPRAYLSTFFDQ